MNQPMLREKHDGEIGGDALGLDGQLSVRVWLRMLSCAMTVEKRLRRRFADHHGTTLPRFDVMAALEGAPDGLTMSRLSQKLLVSNGNVTALVRGLANDGLLEMRPSDTDRRASIVALTDAGRLHFADLAASHHAWVEGMFDRVGFDQRHTLFALLGEVKASIAADAYAADGEEDDA